MNKHLYKHLYFPSSFTSSDGLVHVALMKQVTGKESNTTAYTNLIILISAELYFTSMSTLCSQLTK